MSNSNNITLSNSSGIALSSSEWLDLHFAAMQPEYEEALRWVGIQRGWQVLDAGCGSGCYLPLLTELVGRDGSVSALDIDTENVARIEQFAAHDEWSAPVSARVGNLLALPYDDASFDAVWCANVQQYLTDDELTIAVREMVRVTKSGGLVAIKDWDASGFQVRPGIPDLGLWDIAKNNPSLTGINGVYRLGNLHVWLRLAGLRDIVQKHIPMVRTQPLRPVEQRFIGDLLSSVDHQLVQTSDAPAHINSAWASLSDVTSPNHIFNSPDFMYREIQIVFVGRV